MTFFVLYLKLKCQIFFWPNCSDSNAVAPGMNLADRVLIPAISENYTCNYYT